MSQRQTDDRKLAHEQNLRRRLFCIIDSNESCEQAVEALRAHGISDEHVEVLRGELGAERFEEFMEGKQWGASAEDVFHDGLSALHDGSSVLFVDAETRDDGVELARLLTPFGAREVVHFGDMIDVRLTA